MKTLSYLRKAFHFSGAVIPFLYLVGGKNLALIVTLCFLVAVAAIEWLRIKGRIRLAFLEEHLKETEGKRPTGSIFFICSSLVVILSFSKDVAVAAILVLCISDPLASLIGQRLGRVRFWGKSAEGAAVFFLSAVAVLQFFPFTKTAVLGAALAATATEIFSLRLVDDNLSIPIITAVTLALLS